ncbi:unnamed protein product [Gadus morhua 'NCC']
MALRPLVTPPMDKVSHKAGSGWWRGAPVEVDPAESDPASQTEVGVGSASTCAFGIFCALALAVLGDHQGRVHITRTTLVKAAAMKSGETATDGRARPRTSAMPFPQKTPHFKTFFMPFPRFLRQGGQRLCFA